MNRLANWPDQLIAAIERHERLVYAWGLSDCMQLGMDCVEAMTGAHPYPNAKPKAGKPRYRSKRGADAMLRRHGFGNLIEAWSAAFPEIPSSMARRGDIGIVFEGNVPACVVCEGLLFVGKPPATIGVARVPRARVERAFAVGWDGA